MLESCPSFSHTDDKLYFYYEFPDDQIQNDVFKMFEFSADGVFQNLYSFECSNFMVKFYADRNLLFLHPVQGEIEGGVVRLLRLESGEITLVEEFDASFLFKTRMEDQYFNLKSTIQRFDHFLVTILSQQDHTPPRYYHFDAIDLFSKQRISQACDAAVILPNFQLNWNIEEIGVTYFNDQPSLVGNGELFFKISPFKGYQTSLKHLARLVVMTSFDRDFLVKQNLPNSLFGYLGIIK
ncbi:uncharacterized protein [Clytia hemisphaerica]|uniref:Uncharacterized protein n=1 Tax=Clytia hemisphaerica TaxID=252671 RepID=A0A7M5UXE2_9CNID